MTADPSVLRWLREHVRQLSAYHVPERAGLTLLDAMENPYPWPGALEEAWLAHLKSTNLNRYPDPQAQALKALLRRVMRIPEQADILLGNGSDELIQILALAVTGPDRCIVAPEPSFVMYRMIAGFAGIRFVGVDLKADFSLDLPALKAALRTEPAAILFLAYPNNPTGQCWSRADIEELIAAAPGLVVIDEAYEPFARQSFMGALSAHPNLLVMRTLSKLGLAGLRLGYLCGAPELIAEFDKLRLPYNINSLTQASAEFALEHVEVLDAQASAIRSDRDALVVGLNALPGIEAFTSEANFVLFRTPPGQATRIFEALLTCGLLIKNLSRPGLLADCLRVTVGAEREQQEFLAALKPIVEI